MTHYPCGALAPTDSLVRALGNVGITLEPADGDADTQLYIWTTRAGGGACYIGRSMAAKKIRIASESGWAASSVRQSVDIGFARIAVRHGAFPVTLKLGKVDDALLDRSIEKHLRNFTTLKKHRRDGTVIDVALVERLLIRLCVQGGFFIANSQNAGMWESHLDTFADDLAYLAFNASRDEPFTLTGGIPDEIVEASEEAVFDADTTR